MLSRPILGRVKGSLGGITVSNNRRWLMVIRLYHYVFPQVYPELVQ